MHRRGKGLFWLGGFVLVAAALLYLALQTTDRSLTQIEIATSDHESDQVAPVGDTAGPDSLADDADNEQRLLEDLRAFDPDTLAALLELPDAPFQSAEAAFDERLVRLEAGDRKEGREFAAKLRACRGLLNGRTFRRLIETGSEAGVMQRISQSVQERYVRGHQANARDRLVELRTSLPPCMPFLRHGDQAFRELLEQWADAGNVAARAVYALWPPHRDLWYHDLDAWKHWELRAMEFSLANLAEGESLGFHAFSESYSNGNIFTPGDRPLGLEFKVAALRCGLTDPGALTDSLKYLKTRFEYEAIPAPIIHLLAKRSERLRHYCRSGRWLDDEALAATLQGVYSQ